jgi:hypothetical protein
MDTLSFCGGLCPLSGRADEYALRFGLARKLVAKTKLRGLQLASGRSEQQGRLPANTIKYDAGAVLPSVLLRNLARFNGHRWHLPHG